jgi:hypothetical protein
MSNVPADSLLKPGRSVSLRRAAGRAFLFQPSTRKDHGLCSEQHVKAGAIGGACHASPSMVQSEVTVGWPRTQSTPIPLGSGSLGSVSYGSGMPTIGNCWCAIAPTLNRPSTPPLKSCAFIDFWSGGVESRHAVQGGHVLQSLCHSTEKIRDKREVVVPGRMGESKIVDSRVSVRPAPYSSPDGRKRSEDRQFVRAFYFPRYPSGDNQPKGIGQ